MNQDNNTLWEVWCDATFSMQTNTLKPAAWGAHIHDPQGLYIEKGGDLYYCKTSGEAELWAVLCALQQIPDQANVLVWSDCKGVVDGMMKLVDLPFDALNRLIQEQAFPPFIRNAPAAARQLQIERARLHRITIKWVKGHQNNFGNCRAHWIANNQFKKTVTPFNYKGLLKTGKAAQTKQKQFDSAVLGTHWRTYVIFVQSCLSRHHYTLLKGQSIQATKILCEWGVLNSRMAYSKNAKVAESAMNEERIEKIAALVGIKKRV